MDILKVGIIAAMEEELTLLVDRLDNCEEVQLGHCKYYTGQINGVEVGLMRCGIGKVNAAIGTTLMIDKLKPKCLINTGVAGGFINEMNVGDIVISSSVRHHDADATAFGYELGQIPDMPSEFQADRRLVEMATKVNLKSKARIFEGPVFSGDSFIHTTEQVENILKNFPQIMAVEMEGASIAQTSHLFNIPFVLIRSISDKVRETKSADTYTQSMEESAKNSVQVVFEMVEQLKEGM
ncbi:5'-methylthioadenosine/adenosylhomocysteine nucleosidase [Desulfotalea psychrophila]|uniref:5'-methylthioadenosine/adenosylhomocysteine nucleosidase n=1 Tax=Desulfotalea psychrophila TaxID=84980 RepID=UPI0038992176